MRVLFNIEVAKVKAPGSISIEGIKLSGEKEITEAELRALADCTDRLLDRMIPYLERLQLKISGLTQS